jgi:hypothetical protein
MLTLRWRSRALPIASGRSLEQLDGRSRRAECTGSWERYAELDRRIVDHDGALVASTNLKPLAARPLLHVGLVGPTHPRASWPSLLFWPVLLWLPTPYEPGPHHASREQGAHPDQPPGCSDLRPPPQGATNAKIGWGPYNRRTRVEHTGVIESSRRDPRDSRSRAYVPTPDNHEGVAHLRTAEALGRRIQIADVA